MISPKLKLEYKYWGMVDFPMKSWPSLKYSKSRRRSLKSSNDLLTIADPFAMLKQGNKLKPVSPKMKFPKSDFGLPPRPKNKENKLKVLDKEIERVDTPNFKMVHSKNSGSLIDVRKLRNMNRKIFDADEDKRGKSNNKFKN